MTTEGHKETHNKKETPNNHKETQTDHKETQNHHKDCAACSYVGEVVRAFAYLSPGAHCLMMMKHWSRLFWYRPTCPKSVHHAHRKKALYLFIKL